MPVCPMSVSLCVVSCSLVSERIADQNYAVRVLATLYRHSHDIPGRGDTLKDGVTDKRTSMDPKRFLKKAFRGVKSAATTTTTVLGTVASEIAGTSVLQPNTPQAKVQTALQSANKSRLVCQISDASRINDT